MRLNIRWNFYRIHLTFFTLHPLIWSGIFYGASGRYPVRYIDALFLCFSAQTVTGLSTVNLSSLTGFQQFILFWLMICGDVTAVAWVMVLVRRNYFQKKCAHVIRQRKSDRPPHSHGLSKWTSMGTTRAEDAPESAEKKADDGAVGVEPEHDTEADGTLQHPEHEFALDTSQSPYILSDAIRTDSPTPGSPVPTSSEPTQPPASSSMSPASQFGVASNGTPNLSQRQRQRTISNQRAVEFVQSTGRSNLGMPYTMTNRTTRTNRSTAFRSVMSTTSNSRPLEPKQDTADVGFGGFPTPLTLGARLAQHLAPETYANVERRLTFVPGQLLGPAPPPVSNAEGNEAPDHKEKHLRFRGRTNTAESSDWTDDLESGLVRMVDYLKKGRLWVGRNSFFHIDDLSRDELDMVGGVEYGAIRVLSWLVPVYFVGTQLCCFIIFSAYLESYHEYDSVFTSQVRDVPRPWFSAFQAVSAYTGGGLSLVDQGMVPFVEAKTLVVFLGALIVAGNMLMPVFLRLVIWIIYQVLPKSSSHRPYWQFLLEHPRRCFLYLFPSHQTWFLTAVFFFLTTIEWSGFIVLDIGLPVTEALPSGQRALAGLFQSFGVRASGFSIVSLQALAPACRFLYIIMMYISAYPIAIAVRGTNVYEERSLGVYHDREEQEASTEPQDLEVFSKYLGWHVRQQLAFDIWWLALALLVIDIIERGGLTNPDNYGWFNQFTILFEVVSAYAGVGLSLGIPTENYSFSGALKTGSKIILIFVMLRGRHRDLPMSIDRAILLPEEFSQAPSDPKGRHVMHEEVAERLEREASLMSDQDTPVDTHAGRRDA